jgi:2'-hydroxyisoflavone reductase
MNILVLGGTRFVGRAIVEAALGHGHDLTLFNRGTHSDVLPAARRIKGDRGNPQDVAQIAKGQWDAVVDVNAYRPSEVRSVMGALGDRASHYVYISTISVYADPLPVGSYEDAPLLRVPESIPSEDGHAYGGLKALCEQELRDRISDRLTVLRPTVVIGPHDYTDRFPWWVRKIAAGGTLSVPQRLEQPVQLIDADDLAAFAVRVLEQRIFGTFNTVGPLESLTLGNMIAMLSNAFGSHVGLAPVAARDTDSTFPLTLNADGSDDGFFSVNGAAAYQQGLRLRPLTESARAVLR